MRAAPVLVFALGCVLVSACERGAQRPGPTAPAEATAKTTGLCANAEACQSACAGCGTTCEPAAAEACFLAGEHLLRGERLDLARAAKHYQVACDHGVGRACAALGNLHQDGRGVAHDDARAIELYELACTHGAGVGCSNIGVMLSVGAGVDRDADRAKGYFDRARKLYQRACDAGEHEWCMNLGVMHENGYGVAIDPARATPIYRAGCDAGHADSCVNLALQRLVGRGLERDTAGGLELLDETCTGGSALACAALSQHLLRPADPEAAKPGADRVERGLALGHSACDDGIGQACVILGLEYGSGDQVARDARRALGFLERACSLGKMHACRLAAEQLWASDMPRAIDFLGRACAIGEPEACTLVANREEARGAEADQARVTDLYQQGCRMGVPDACLALMRRGDPLPPMSDDRKQGLLRALCDRGIAAACDALE